MRTPRAVLFLLALLAAVAGVLTVGAGSAAAAGETVQGTLRFNQQLQSGVHISATGPGGFTASATSDANGRWVIEVPGPGRYVITLDEKTLGEGVTLRNPDRNPFTTTVNGGESKTVLFALGESTRQVESQADQTLNRFAQGIRFGLLVALAAVGISLIFGTTGLTNFAHGELVTLGGIVAYYFNVVADLPFAIAIVLTLIVCGIVGYLLDLGLWSRLRHRGTGLIAMMIVSIGLSLFVRYLFLFVFGGTTKSFSSTQGQKSIGPGPITLTTLDYVSMAICVLVLLAVAYFLLRTRVGKATRAVSDNPALASASGIDVERVIRVVWVISTALAGLAGILLGIAQQVNFQMGFQILLLVFAAVTLGGLGTAFGALVGALIVGLFVEMSTLVIPAELKNAAALAILILVLIVRPQGILGRRVRVG